MHSRPVLTPDDKDWTWVLERPCPQCGFDARAVDPTGVADLVRLNVGDWRRLLAAGAVSSGRPVESRWSSLEYACHVRDVYVRYNQRIGLMLDRDDPLFPNWDQDASAVDDRYDAQDPVVVIDELAAAADALAGRLDAIGDNEWIRPGRRSDGASFTVDSISRYLVHDTIHHVWDVTASA